MTPLSKDEILDFYRRNTGTISDFAKAVERAAYERAAMVVQTPVSGEQDDITMAAKDRAAKAIRAMMKEGV